MIALRDIRKGEQRVEVGHDAGALLDACNFRGKLLSQFLKEIEFKGEEFLLRAEYALLKLPEFFGRVALCIRERLPPPEVIRHLGEKGIRHLKIIAEYLVVLNL